jgi:hypothetical protein
MAAVVGFKLLVSWFLSFVFPYGQFD